MNTTTLNRIFKDDMVVLVDTGAAHVCHSFPLLLGYFSLLNPLKTIFLWMICTAYSISTLLKQANLSILPFYIGLHYHTIAFLLLCIIVSAIRLRCSRLFDRSTLYRLGVHFRARRFYHKLVFCTGSSVIISSAVNGNIIHQDLIGLGFATIFINWQFFPSLIKVSFVSIRTC